MSSIRQHAQLWFALVIACFSQSANANVVGSDLQNFNASTSGIDFVTVQSSETLEMGIINLGLMLNHAVNSLPVYEDERKSQNRLKFNDTLLTSEVLAGIGLWENWDAGISASRLLRQAIDDDSPAHGEFTGPGWTNIRANTKYKFWSNDLFGLAAIFTANFNLIRNNPYLGTKQSPIYNFEIAADTRFLDIVAAINLGYRWREAGEKRPNSLIEPTKNQIIGSAAASYLLPFFDVKVIAEIFASRPVGQKGSENIKRQASSMESIAGLKYDYTTNLAFHAGGGTEFLHGVSSPDWRVYAGVNWTIGPTFGSTQEIIKKKDKVIVYSLEFGFDSAEMVAESQLKLDELIDYLESQKPFSELIVEGHTDSVGAESYNQQLSEKRAATVKDALSKSGKFDDIKFQAVGFGEKSPIADNGNFQGRKANRRVEIRIVTP